MDFKSLIFLILSLASAYPSVDRYITELPSNLNWPYDGMVADQPYAPVRPSASAYVYQIDDPTANYIFSTNYWSKKDPTPYTKRSRSSTTDSLTRTPPTRGPNFKSRSVTLTEAIPAAPVTLHVTHMTSEPPAIYKYYSIYGTRPITYYPLNYVYSGNVYSTPFPYEYTSSPASSFVQPNVLHSDYLTYFKPFYVVNNALYSFIHPLHRVYIYEPPKQYVHYDYVIEQQQQPAVPSVEGYDPEAIKIQNNPSIVTGENIPVPDQIQNNSSAVAVANKPAAVKIQKKPIETNLTKINIDPITEAEARFSFHDGESRAALTTSSSNIIHKQRPIYHNTYGIMYHKLPRNNLRNIRPS
ncbi:uncharacterized protein LOC135833181 [Planococcus citri]|uniref:uncharacterized protein LOC135833181 n=1 Tax=Planococcus citri TaxID=170843 RepID=UPI0031F80A31